MSNFAENLKKIENEMRACNQAAGLTVLQHGELVRDYYMDLRSHLMEGKALAHEWRLPDWIVDRRLVDQQLDVKTVETYTVYHDCGKPRVRVVDDEGGQHFPDHAAASEALWREIGGDEQVARLIGMDMDVHVLKDVDVASFALRPEAATLLWVALSEIHANASMFGGMDSVSFKMKWKQIDKRGKATLRAWG